MELMTVKNTNHDNKIDYCVEIIANEGNNENLVPEPCSFINMDQKGDEKKGQEC